VAAEIGAAGIVDETALRSLVQEVVAAEISQATIVDEQTLRAIVGSVVVETPEATPGVELDYLADDDPYFGAEDAPITIVEFGDYLCLYCGRFFQQTFPLLQENYGQYIRFVYRDFPGVGGQGAVKVAMATQCVNDQNRYWDYHALLFNNQAALQTAYVDDTLRALLIDYAEDLGLDIAAFTTCYDNQTYLSEVNADAQAARENGVSGTPTFFINGMILVGAQPYQNFADIIDSELNRLGIERSGG